MLFPPLPRLIAAAALVFAPAALPAQSVTPAQATAAMKKAAEFYRTKAASHGGYVYYYSPDLSRRLGEGAATPEQIWVQQPGTPAVGLAFLKAYAATGDSYFLDGAREAAEALVYGQLESGGWTNAIDFDPKGSRVAQYRNGKGRGRNYSSFDDGISQHALRLLMHVDRALGFKHAAIHEASEIARKTSCDAQFASGAFPQGWTGPVAPQPLAKANYPDYDWRTENRRKEYWDYPTLNDDLALHLSAALEDAWLIYHHERCRQALSKLGDFLVRAQMPEPQPAWAQQYDHEMRPIWARKFEPPAIAGRESLGAMETLLRVHRVSGDPRYLAPIPSALAYLKRSLLPDGKLARYYELKSNKPLFMTADYRLTYNDADAPKHYGWKTESRIAEVEAAYRAAKAGAPVPAKAKVDSAQAAKIVRDLDTDGKWLVAYEGQGLVGQPKFKPGERFISSEVFCENLTVLSEFVTASRPGVR